MDAFCSRFGRKFIIIFKMGNRQLSKQMLPRAPYRRGLKRGYIFVADRVRGPRGAKVYSFRMRAGLSITALGKMMHAHPQSIYLWECGKVEPGDMAWNQFQRVQRNWAQRLRRFGVDLDGGPVMEE